MGQLIYIADGIGRIEALLFKDYKVFALSSTPILALILGSSFLFLIFLILVTVIYTLGLIFKLVPVITCILVLPSTSISIKARAQVQLTGLSVMTAELRVL
ncbi:hypothetical protein BELL_1174g00030 [Botrytis elliptica]|uniref:Uncharacterized protein n=1 Tax=Botrytis elliptica TaxID=278938 RepID=A0A4Z1INV9_9HELO|nr:hypothetical protein BELL_1174g00030 [Botrytis elliptica]